MPPQRVADAAQIAPYLTHIVSHHGQLTLIPPDNAGRVRKAKQKTSRSRTRQLDRSPRQEEEIRFNTGPKVVKLPAAQSSRTPRRAARPPVRPNGQERARTEEFSDDIPDYPPPSFLEAISTPALSIYPSTTTLANAHPFPPLPSASIPNAPQPTPSHSAADASGANSDSESEGSLEIVELEDRLEETNNDNGLQDASSDQQETLSIYHSRGRTRSRGVLESDTEVTANPSLVSLGKRRTLSLSPLRTMFPTWSSGVQDRSPAHTSPYARSSTSFFKSTTSLKTVATASFPRLASASSFSLSGSDSGVPRRLFSKGKERAKESESLDSWEILDDEPPASLLTAVESVTTPSSPHSGPPSPIPASPKFPTEHKTRLIRGEQIPQSPSAPLQAPESPRNLEYDPTAVHPLSKRDKKPPPPPILRRPRRKAPPPPIRDSITQSAPASPSSPTNLSGPPIISVRTRHIPAPPPPLPPRKKVPITSPLSAESWTVDSPVVSDTRAMLLFQKALETPLPLTPVDTSNSVAGTSRSSSNNPQLGADSTSEQVQASSPRTYSSSSSTNVLLQPRQHLAPPSPAIEHSPYPHRSLRPLSIHSTQSLPPPTPTRSPQTPQNDSGEINTTPTQTRHHYPGRPLPRPPGATQSQQGHSNRRSMVDSVFATSQDDLQAALNAGVPCPEGLLIDFGDPVASSEDVSASSTDEHQMESSTASQVHGRALLRESQDAQQQSPSLAQISPDPAVTSGEASTPVRYSELTDLDVLMSRLNDEDQRNGSNYDTLLLVSEFIGPARPPVQNAPDASSQPSNATATATARSRPNQRTFTPALVSGNIALQRRRVTKDGRVKLKLAFLDVSVDKCGICLTQFKEGDKAEMSGNRNSTCRHVFHTACLERWLKRSRTCPMCRVVLDAE